MKHFHFIQTRFIAITILSLLVCATAGCRRSIERTIIRQELPSAGTERVDLIVLRDGSQVVFDEAGGSVRLHSNPGRGIVSVVGRTIGGKQVEISEEQILEARLGGQSFNATGTLLLLVGIAGAGFVVIAGIAGGGIR